MSSTYLFHKVGGFGKVWRALFSYIFHSKIGNGDQTFPNPPTLWKRYVDDTFVITEKHVLNDFHKHINSIEQSIKFTVELESDNLLPFLDVLIVKERNGKLTTTLYQKPTHTNQFLNYNSQFTIFKLQLNYNSQFLKVKNAASFIHS